MTLEHRIEEARELSWRNFGKEITFYLPGMFSYYGLKGRYPAISITGTRCALQCEHCKGRTLETMTEAATPESLVANAVRMAGTGKHGILISGGCDREGRLPWGDYIPAIKEIKERTDLYVSVHSGLLDDSTALGLREAGVDQALIDVIGDNATYRAVYHVPFDISRIADSLKSMNRAGLPVVPHVVCGLNFGKISGEFRAIEMISRAQVEQVVIVSLMGIPRTPMEDVIEPAVEDVMEVMVEARFSLPMVRMSLGCARKRGESRLETLAVDAGVNRMALPSEEAVQRAIYYGLRIRYQRSCCSVSRDFSGDRW